MVESEYTSISLKYATVERLKEAKITPGEYWDDEINRILDQIENMSKSVPIKEA